VIIPNELCFAAFQGPEIDDDEVEGEDVVPGHGIDDGFFDEKHVPDGRGERIPLPEYPRRNGNGNGNTPSRPPDVFPLSPPEYGGPGIVSFALHWHRRHF
jgi:hypothetical protein